jgi:hypothetical protein
VPYCSEAALAHAADPTYSGLLETQSPICPAATQIGTAVAGAGAGTHPLYVPGKVYLAGPYKGAPLSLVVITPAVSGPYDLGNVVVRAALHVDPTSAQISAVSDPLPHILEGVPLRLRTIRVNLDRSDFTLNPTNCTPFSVGAQVSGDQGAVAGLSRHFQVANCGTLPFGPKLALRFSGPTTRAKNPALHATLTARPGEANIASAKVLLPRSELIDNAHIDTVCTRVQFAANACPTGSAIGYAKAETPLLDKPLGGPVYLRSAPNSKSGLPDIVAALRGQIEIDLVGHNDSVNEHLRTTFDSVPDAPVSSFTLTLDGGSKGLLESNSNLCSGPQVARQQMTAQNGKRASSNLRVQTPCGSKGRHKRRLSHARAVR